MGIQPVKKNMAEYLKKRQEELARVKEIQSRQRETIDKTLDKSRTKTTVYRPS